MASKKKWTRRDVPYCADPENHVLVTTREGIFWRRKRSKALLNEAFARNADLSKITGPAARTVVEKLRTSFNGMDTGRITLRISNGLRKGLKETKKMDYCCLNGLEIQRDYPLGQLLKAAYRMERSKEDFRICISMDDPVLRQNQLATHFYFEAVLLQGEPGKDDLKVESTESRLYSFDQQVTEACVLTLQLPVGRPWMVLLKVSCLEGDQIAVHPKHYGMKVVGTGFGVER